MSIALTQLRTASRTFPAFFRFRQVGDRVLITNFEGRWQLLTQDEFAEFAAGTVAKTSDLYARLRDNNFVRAEYDTKKAAQMLAARKQFIHHGPNLHVMVVTLRCNETCVYCHASRADMDAVHTDMTPETAEKAVDLALQTTSPALTIEFQGGEPLVNFPVVKHIIAYATERNKTAGKQLEFTMVSNLSLMTDEKLEYLLANRVQICTSIDGPQALHDKQRKLPRLSSFNSATAWIARINKAYEAKGLDPLLYHVEALLTTTRQALPLWKEIIDTYVGLGCRAIFLRPVDPFGWAERTGDRVEYPRAEYMKFYRSAVDYMLELNAGGTQVLERYASIFLTKILSGEDPNFLDVRTPSGGGIGQIAYSYDGKVFSCDEGRMLHESGDDTFLLGDVRTSGYRDLVGHPTVRAMVIASNLQGQPDCVNCTYNPYCGIPSPHSHKTMGTLFGRARESSLCSVHKGIQDYLFEKLGTGDAQTLETFRRWTTVRARTHFLQTPDVTNASVSG